MNIAMQCILTNSQNVIIKSGRIGTYFHLMKECVMGFQPEIIVVNFLHHLWYHDKFGALGRLLRGTSIQVIAALFTADGQSCLKSV